MSPAKLDRLQALLHEALDYDMGPVPQSLISEALTLLEPEAEPPVDPVLAWRRVPNGLELTDEVSGVPWLVHLVRPGEQYGIIAFPVRPGQKVFPRACLNDSGKTLVEFWDRRYAHDAEHKAQFVSRYYLSTLKGRFSGLCLDGGRKEWALSDRSMLVINSQLLKFVEV